MTTLKLLLLVLATSQLYLSAFANPIFARSTGMQVLPNATFAFSVDNKLNMPVHSSCSDNKLLAINHALSDLYTLSHVALTELLDPATTSASLLDGPEQHPLLTSLYFGDAKRPNSMATAVGFFTMILLRDKQGLLLRCDDPDGKCKEHSDWAGHWRGDENPGETVICDRSFTGQQETTTDNASTGPVKRDAGDATTVPAPITAPAPSTVPASTNATASALPAATGDEPGKKSAPPVEPRKFLDDVCLNGWTLSESRPEVFWSTDLIHRFVSALLSSLCFSHFVSTDKLKMGDNACSFICPTSRAASRSTPQRPTPTRFTLDDSSQSWQR